MMDWDDVRYFLAVARARRLAAYVPLLAGLSYSRD
jgi:hypothetical protein